MAHVEQAKDSHMSDHYMSKDRVRFYLPERIENSSNFNGICEAIQKAFGTTYGNIVHSVGLSAIPKYPERRGYVIVCRPSQFARFLIFRNDFGCQNYFQELCPELIPAVSEKMFMDVSKNGSR